MLRSRFLWKLYAGYSALILTSSAIVGIMISQRVEGDALAEIQQSLHARAVLLEEVASQLSEVPDSSFQQRISILGTEIATRLTVIGADGTVIADSDEYPSEMDNHADRPEILAARSHGIGTATRYSNTLKTRMMYLSLPVVEQGQIVAYIRTALPLSTIDGRLNHLRYTIVLGAGLSAIIALLLGLLLTNHYVRPLASMTSIAESMSHGDYDKRLVESRVDEIGKLAQALNRMAESCSNRTDTIKADRNKLSTILSGMTEGVVAVGLDEHVLHLNEAAGKLLGVSPLESLDKPIWQVTRVPEITEILTDSLRDGTSAQRKLLITTKLTDQSLEMDASPLHDGQGNLVGAVVVLHDVSELNRLEMVRREFVANASHELKTPITAIRGLVETLIDDEELEPAKRDRFLGKIKDQSIRLGSIVTDLLTISRLESESNETEEMSFDLCEVVQSTSSVFISTGEEQDITVKVQVPNSPIELSGDEEALRQIVSNLLDNAVKYSSTGGEVCVRLHRHDDHAILEVEDTGIGIEPKDQDRIFERFYRVDKARSRELGGTGLGLAIVKHIAQSHGGNVSLDSIPGTGSTFKVILPLAGRSA